MFTTPAVDLVRIVEMRGGSGPAVPWRTRVRGAPAFNGEQPAACLAEEITTPGPGRVRGLLTVAGNPVLSSPNGRALERALEELEYFAAVDIYVNETTRHADLILPPTWSLETDNYEMIFHLLAVRNTAKYSPPVLAPPAGARHDWEILLEISLRLAERKAKAWTRAGLRALRAVHRVLAPKRYLDWLIRLGPHGDGFRPWRRGLRVRDLVAEPRGIDLGALEPCLDRVLHTDSKRIDLAHPVMLAELERLAVELEDPPEVAADALLLIGRRDPRTNNSWLHNAPLAVKGRDRCTLLVHPDDAKQRGLETGARARIRSRVGEVVASVVVSDEVMPGVVSLPHGWGHHRPGMRMRLAEANPGVSVNDLTDAERIEPVVGNAILNGVPVHVEAAAH